MMTYLKYLLFTLPVAAVFPFVLLLFVRPFFAVLFTKRELKRESKTLPGQAHTLNAVAVFFWVASAAFICTLAAYLSSLTAAVASNPSIKSDWLFYVTGFFICHAPFTYIQRGIKADGDRLTFLYFTIFALAAYVLFIFWPSGVELLWGRWVPPSIQKLSSLIVGHTKP